MRFLLLFLALTTSALATVRDDVRAITERHPDAITSVVKEDFLPYLRQGDIIIAIPSRKVKAGDLVWTAEDRPAVLSKITAEGHFAKEHKKTQLVQTSGKVYAILHPQYEMLAEARRVSQVGTLVAAN